MAKTPKAIDNETFAELWQDYAETGPREGTRWSDPAQFSSILGLVRRWQESSDPSFMDHAILMCEHEGLPILPSLLKHVADAARLRKDSKGASLSRAERESNKHRALRVVANLKALGFTLARASEVAAIWSKDNGIKAVKASTLEAEYVRKDWKDLEEKLRSEYESDDEGFAKLRASWLKFERDSREITQEEKGERR